MSLTIRVYTGEAGNFAAEDVQNGKADAKTIDARSLKLNAMPHSAVEEKRNSAKRQAMKLISDAWGRDEKVSRNIQNMRDEKRTRIDELGELEAVTGKLKEEKEMYKEAYGISGDSQEQKDLELLEKYQNNKTGASFDSFSEEEISRLKELQNIPLTEYQKQVLALNSEEGKLRIDIERKKSELVGITQAIQGAVNEQEKSQDMLNAQEAADAIMAAASKDIIGMLKKEAMNHVDEALEEQKEKAEEATKKKEEQEERIEEAKEKREEQQEMQQEIIEGDREADRMQQDFRMESKGVDYVAEAQKSIQKILKENSMINEDIKGIEIDLNF